MDRQKPNKKEVKDQVINIPDFTNTLDLKTFSISPGLDSLSTGALLCVPSTIQCCFYHTGLPCRSALAGPANTKDPGVPGGWRQDPLDITEDSTRRECLWAGDNVTVSCVVTVGLVGGSPLCYVYR